MRLRRCGAFSKSLSWFDHRLVDKHKVFKNVPQCGKHKHNCVNAYTFYLHFKVFFPFKCLISQGMSLVCLWRECKWGEKRKQKTFFGWKNIFSREVCNASPLRDGSRRRGSSRARSWADWSCLLGDQDGYHDNDNHYDNRQTNNQEYLFLERKKIKRGNIK